MKRILTLCLALSLMLPLSAFGAEEPSTFTDVSPDDWFAPYVEVCVEEGLMLGTGEGKFSPYQNLNSAECVLLIARLHQLINKGAVEPFPQPPSDGSLEQRLAQAPDWARAGFYYVISNGLAPWGMACDLYPTDRSNFLFALEGVVDPRTLEPLNTIELLPDAPLDCYWSGSAGTTGDLVDFYRAGILSGTDEYGTFDGSLPLTRATAAAMLARILRPELRLTYTLSPYPWETKYELTELRVNANDWWNGNSSWNEPSRSDHSIKLETLWVCPGRGNVEYDKCGILGMDDQWIVEPGQYASIGPFYSDGLAAVASSFSPFEPGCKYGIIDAQGREILPMIYDDYCLGGDGMIGALVLKEELLYLFDSQGKPLGRISAQGIAACGIREGLILIVDRKTALWGYMDLTGEIVVPPQFEAAGLFYEGRAAVVMDGKTGYIDPTGQLVIPCQYEAISQFGNEHHFRDAGALVVDEEGYGLMIDRDGNQLSPRRYESLDANFSPNGVAFYGYWDEEAQSYREGYLDTQGREHPMPDAYFRDPYHAIAFSGGYYLISWNYGGTCYNYMDQDGKLLSPTWFREGSPITEKGTAIVLREDGTYCRLELKK